MSTTITWNGMEDCRDLFARLREQTDDLRPVLGSIGTQLTESAKDRIQDEKKAPNGTAWPSYVNPSYASLKRSGIRRKKHYPGASVWILAPSPGGLLDHSGNLLKSIIYNVSSDKVYVGSNEEYARRHQEGGGGIPARPYLGISDDDANAINQFIRDALGE